MFWIAYAAAWLCTSVAVIVGLLATGDWGVLFFMLLPLAINTKNAEPKKEENKNV